MVKVLFRLSVNMFICMVSCLVCSIAKSIVNNWLGGCLGVILGVMLYWFVMIRYRPPILQCSRFLLCQVE